MAKNQITISEMARRGGLARKRKLSAQERSDAARRAVQARWKKWRKENNK